MPGGRLTLTDLEAKPQDHLPCDPRLHRGWHSGQEWTGVRLDLLLDATGRRSFVAWSETGYARRFPIRDLESTWLVTRLGGEPLGPDHGFPAPDRGSGETGLLVGEMGGQDRAFADSLVASVAVPAHLSRESPGPPPGALSPAPRAR